jgi:peptidoglycan/xylan/chitin deacetylase (PgdA/CDA1 family)
MNLKRGMVRLLAGAPAALAPGRSGIASIFMLHRFGREAHGHDPLVVRRLLGWLRTHRFDVLDLEDLFRRLGGEGAPIRRAVAFTIDDGYADQAEIAAPVFAEYDAPVTTFLATGFLDGTLWLWWDQIEYLLQGSRRDHLTLTVQGQPVDLHLGGPLERQRATEKVVERCKFLPDAERLATIAALARLVERPVPDTPPSTYRPMTWDQARRCEAAGMRFGPHTVTHPILARTADTQAAREVRESWRRLCQEVSRPQPIFCYPNGRIGDFGPREAATLRSLGLLGAVTAQPGYAAADDFGTPDGRFQVPRFSFSEEHEDNIRYASGLEWLWHKMRGRA